MLRKFHIDQLLLFFLLAIAAMLLCFGTSLVSGTVKINDVLVKYVDARTMLHLPEQGMLHNDRTIEVYNPEMELWYSLNGGDHFLKAAGSIELDEIQNPDLKIIPTSFHWKIPTGVFPEAKSIVVKVKHPERALVSEEITLTYFSEPHGNLPVVTINMPGTDLISEDKGLMIFGTTAMEDDGFYKNWWNRSANFQQRGSAWEKEVQFQFFESGKLEHEQTCGLKISGNATRGFPQKSFQLVARLNYGADKFDFPLLGDEGLKKYTSVVLRNSGNDNTKTMFADLVMQQLAESGNVLTQKGRPAVLYLNGNYWGIYNIRERIDPYYISKKEDVKDDEITILEGSDAVLKDGDSDVKASFDILRDKISHAGPGDQKLYKKLEEQVDLNSFSDYIIFETYFANNDWPGNNSMWYKAGEKKWKWILNDLDYGMAYLGEKQVEADLFDKLATSESAVGELFNFLITCSAFKKIFQKRADIILNSQLSEKRIRAKFEETKELYALEIERHIRRWRMIDSPEAWEENCTANLNFLINRRNIYRNQLKKFE